MSHFFCGLITNQTNSLYHLYLKEVIKITIITKNLSNYTKKKYNWNQIITYYVNKNRYNKMIQIKNKIANKIMIISSSVVGTTKGIARK